MNQSVAKKFRDMCANCGHPDHWHRHDDATTNDKFRCIGYDCEVGGPPVKDGCDCPDFQKEPDEHA